MVKNILEYIPLYFVKYIAVLIILLNRQSGESRADFFNPIVAYLSSCFIKHFTIKSYSIVKQSGGLKCSFVTSLIPSRLNIVRWTFPVLYLESTTPCILARLSRRPIKCMCCLENCLQPCTLLVQIFPSALYLSSSILAPWNTQLCLTSFFFCQKLFVVLNGIILGSLITCIVNCHQILCNNAL